MASIIDIRSRRPKNRPRIGVIIQARMTSRRFPGKSMTMLLDKPVIQHTIERAKQIKAGIKNKYDNPIVILAVPDTDESEPMLELATELQIENFCGSELNVLERYYHAAIHFKLDYIVRITGDCPFIDAKVSSEVLQLLLWRKCDYTSNVFPERTYPKGLDTEAFTMDALEVSYLYWKETFKDIQKASLKEINDLEYLAEHVTPFLQAHPEIKRALVRQHKNRSQMDWCVDEPHDIARLEKLATRGLKLVNDNDE